MEDQKIRHYKIEDREPLRKINSPEWPKVFMKYCHDVASPIQSTKISEQLEWLLGFAVRLEYADNGMYIYIYAEILFLYIYQNMDELIK